MSLLAVDDFVNNDMVAEMFNILGYHLPNSSQYISEKQEPHKYFDPKLYCSQLSIQDLEKIAKFTDKRLNVSNIANNLTPGDVRAIIRFEDSETQLRKWSRLLPTCDQDQFNLVPAPTYYDCLLHSWLLKCQTPEDRNRSLERVYEYCNVAYHLRVPEKRYCQSLFIGLVQIPSLKGSMKKGFL